MIENTLTDYKQTLVRFNSLSKEFEQLEQATHDKLSILREESSRLDILRYQTVYSLMEIASLGVCTAEIIPEEFKDFWGGHRKIAGLSRPERLGIFPIGQLRFLYFHGPGYDSTPYFEQSYTKEFILLLCPHHFPKAPEQETTLSELPDDLSKVITCELHRSEGKFTSRDEREFSAPYPQTPLPEAIFEYFQIPPLPKKP